MKLFSATRYSKCRLWPRFTGASLRSAASHPRCFKLPTLILGPEKAEDQASGGRACLPFRSPPVFPERPERRLAPPRCSVIKLHREALAGAADPETAWPSKLIAPTQEGGWRIEFPQTLNAYDGAFSYFLGRCSDMFSGCVLALLSFAMPPRDRRGSARQRQFVPAPRPSSL